MIATYRFLNRYILQYRAETNHQILKTLLYHRHFFLFSYLWLIQDFPQLLLRLPESHLAMTGVVNMNLPELNCTNTGSWLAADATKWAHI